jgi:hypothetical protein
MVSAQPFRLQGVAGRIKTGGVQKRRPNSYRHRHAAFSSLTDAQTAPSILWFATVQCVEGKQDLRLGAKGLLHTG